MSLRQRLRERGEGNLGCLFWSFALVVVLMISWKAVPVKIASSRLNDYMVEQAKFAVNLTPQVLRTRILNKAQQLDLPITRGDIQVQKMGGRIEMRCQYSVPLEFPFYTYVWDFDLDIERGIYQF